MQTLRQSYQSYQQDAYNKKPIYPTSSKAFKSVKLAEEEITRMQNVGDFGNYDQTVFYKEKFEALYDISSKYEKKKMDKDLFQDQVRAILAKNYQGVSFIQSKVIPSQSKSQQPLIQPSRHKSKSPLKQFFDQQQSKNAKKVTFSNLLSSQQTPLKYGLKSTVRSRLPSSTLKNTNNNDNDIMIRKLRQENQRLRLQLDSQRSLHGGDDDKFSQLRSQISDLSEENRRLKSQVQSKTSSKSQIAIIDQQYDPYNIKVRQNNIMRINSKNLSISERYSQIGSQYMPKQTKGNQIYYDNQSELAKSQFTYNPQNYTTINKDRQNNALSQDDQLLNTSHSTIQTQFLNMDQTEIMDDQKHHVCRQKIAFFKKAMVLYKGQTFDIAFKRSDLNTELDRLRIILYVNNKNNKKMDCNIEYDYERDDFDIIIKKRIEKVVAMGQGREQIQVFLKNPTDMGSLITAKVLVGPTMKKIIIPALFINFDPNYKSQFENIGYIERNLAAPLIIKPMGQFATLQNTSNILQLSRQYDANRPTAKIYGKSKVTKGIVKFTWKENMVKIETCEQWRTLMGYLFLNAEETLLY